MIRFAFCLALFAAPAAAQSWETFAAGSRIGAGICPRAMSHADDGTFCLSVICDGGEGPFVDLSFLGFAGLPERADIRLQAAGTPFGGAVDAATDGQVTVYRLDLSEPAQEALRRGIRAAATVSEPEGEPILELLFPLAGSSAGIERANGLCTAVRNGGSAEGEPPERAFTREAVEAELVDRDLGWAGAVTRLAADRTATRKGGDGAASGRWHFEGTDRVCLTMGEEETSCLRFFRAGGELRVRRADAGGGADLGAVRIAE